MEFVEGCNAIIAGTMKPYTDGLKEIDLPTANQCSSAEIEISHIQPRKRQNGGSACHNIAQHKAPMNESEQCEQDV